MYKRLTVGILGAAFIVGACGGGGGESPAASQGGGGSPAASGDLAGKTVTVAGGMTGADGDNFNLVLQTFAKESGITIEYSGVSGFEVDLNVRIQAGNPPDIGSIPQPGAVQNYIKTGAILPLPDDVAAHTRAELTDDWLAYSTGADGKLYGVQERANIKGLVYYPKADFEAAGYTVPKTWDELIALEQKMAADGTPAWCVGIGSGAASGWPATDWLEAIMLRVAGPEGYDDWVTHVTPFTDAKVVEAATLLQETLTDPTRTYGGPEYVATTQFGDSPKDAYSDPRKCWLINQGSFILNFLPDDIKADVENIVGVFPLPEIDPQFGQPALVGGDIMVAFRDAPEVWAVMDFFTRPDHAVALQQVGGGTLIPHKNQDVSAYSNAIDRQLAQVMLDASARRFDGSDLMPATVGAGSFWSEMVKMIGSGQDVQTTLSNIEATWPSQ